MALVKHISLIFKSLLTFTALFGLLFAVVHYMNLSFTLDGARRILAEQIQTYTGRDVRIDGDVELSISLFPQLLVQRIHIRNLDDFGDEDFITIKKARIEVQLLSLLSGELLLSDISAEHAKISLVQKKDGSHNWSFEKTGQTLKQADIASTKSGTEKFTMGIFQLNDVALVYSDESRDQVIRKHLDRLIIDLQDRARPIAEINGSIEEHPYSITFESDALDIITTGKPWLLHGKGTIADSQTKIEARLQLLENELSGNADINVKKVDLGRLLETLGIISGQEASTDNINITAKIHGSSLAELYEQAEIRLQLGNGYWNLKLVDSEQEKNIIFTSASSFTSWNKPVELHAVGFIAAKPIELDFKTNRLFEFFDDVQKLDVDLVANIAEIDLSMKGSLELPIKTKQFQLDISLDVKDLEKINPIINTEFPPFNDFRLAGNLIANDKGFVLKSANASIGDSQLQASIVVETYRLKPLWIINLKSQQLQIEDFLFDDWNIKQADITTKKSSNKERYDKAVLEPLQRLEEFVHEPKTHFNLNVDIDKVFSRGELLGKARFQLHLRDNAVSLNNANIEIPGGQITSSTSIKITGNKATGNAQLNIDKFDYGLATRMFNPDSEVDGTISTRIDLQLGGSDFTRLLDNATGQIDFAVWPKNTQPAKALNLWTTNLYLILLPELKKKESLVNCMVGLLDLDKGIMKEKLFAIDTTKLWIHGNINVDFSHEQVSLSLFPRSKTARLFSLQTPIRAQGSFSNISLAINPVDMTGTYISFITSPLHVPTRWIFGDKIPADASAVCAQYFDREHVTKLKNELQDKELKAIEEMLESD